MDLLESEDPLFWVNVVLVSTSFWGLADYLKLPVNSQHLHSEAELNHDLTLASGSHYLTYPVLELLRLPRSAQRRELIS
jgi:hypothetical protein